MLRREWEAMTTEQHEKWLWLALRKVADKKLGLELCA